MPVAGLRGTGSWGTGERPKEFRESILFRNPNGTAPIFALSSKSGKITVRDPEFSWWDEPNDVKRFQVAGALTAADTVVTIDSSDPDATTPNRLYGKAGHLKKGDLLLVEPAADNATFNHELLEVQAVISDTQFAVFRGAGGTTAATISNDVFLTLIGSAYPEGSGLPPAASRNPIKYTNYTQIFKDPYEITKTADVTEARTGPAWSNDKKRKRFDHAQAIEWSMMFGRAYETIGDNGMPKRYMGGLRNLVGNVTVFGSAMTRSTFLDAIAPVFDFDTGAGDSRFIFAGNAALMALQKVFASTTGIIQDLGPKTKVYGMNLTEFQIPHGTVYIKTHPLLSRHPLYKWSAFIMDFDSFKYVTLPGRDTKENDDVQAKDEDVRRGFIQTECSVRVDRGGLTMAYLGNMKDT